MATGFAFRGGYVLLHVSSLSISLPENGKPVRRFGFFHSSTSSTYYSSRKKYSTSSTQPFSRINYEQPRETSAPSSSLEQNMNVERAKDPFDGDTGVELDSSAAQREPPASVEREESIPTRTVDRSFSVASRKDSISSSSARVSLARALAYKKKLKEKSERKSSGNSSPLVLPAKSANSTDDSFNDLSNRSSTSAGGKEGIPAETDDGKRLVGEGLGFAESRAENDSADTLKNVENVTKRAFVGLERSELFKQQKEEMMSALQAKKEERQGKESGLQGGEEEREEGNVEGRQSSGGADETERKQGRKGGEEVAKIVAGGDSEVGMVEVEIVTRDGIIRKKFPRSEMEWGKAETRVKKSGGQQQRGSISAIDFVGLGFSDDKNSSRSSVPAGLYAPLDRPPPGKLPEVEIITRDSGSGPKEGGGEGEELYKPKVATWGVFPRPRDVSSAFGGGRTILPGQSLETAEEKEAREAKTRKLLEDYNRRSGLTIDPAVKAECDEVLNVGMAFMDRGRLLEAVEKFDFIIAKVPFKNVLHGKAALQKALCLDSLARSNEARVLYEQLAAHPDPSVKKKSAQLLFGFQAADNLRVRRSNWDPTLYRKYFDAVAGQYNTMYRASEDEKNDNSLQELLVFALLLIWPVLLVTGIVSFKNFS